MAPTRDKFCSSALTVILDTSTDFEQSSRLTVRGRLPPLSMPALDQQTTDRTEASARLRARLSLARSARHNEGP
eukprot:m.590246 g.590246  ORF g.590246 m.590246 type:complete len:74 (+) comp58010_c0_seq1:2817-3038(+)